MIWTVPVQNTNMRKIKILLIILSLSLLSAGCGFSKPQPAGIIKTNNGGTDWLFANKIKDSENASIQGIHVSRMAFSPIKRETLFVSGYNSGIYKSEDSAGSWSPILTKLSVYDFAINPHDEKIIYAAGLVGGQGKLVKTGDGGATWVDVYNDASSNNPVRAVAINPASPTQLVIGLAGGNIVMSNDSGLSWKLVYNFNDRVNRIYWQNGGIYVILKSKGFFKTMDLGRTFTELSASLNKTVGVGNLQYNQNTVGTYNQAYIDPLTPSLLYLTTDNGVFKTTDEGTSWKPLPLPVKAEDSFARGIGVAKTSSNTLFTNVGSTIYKSTDGGQTFQTQAVATGGEVNYFLIDPQVPQIVYAGIYLNE